MLTELRIQDYAVIDDLTLTLGSGLNVLTGETGAGKSIIVGALSLVLGDRASSDVVRTGSERAFIEASFDVSGHTRLLERLEELGLEGDGGALVIRREIQAEGRNRAWVNGVLSTASVVSELGSALVDLHGQHEHQSLLRREEQRAILDRYADATRLCEEVKELYLEVAVLRKELAGREERREELQARADRLCFQMVEIEDAGVRLGEEEELAEEAERLGHAQELLEGASRVYDALYGEETAVSDRLSEIKALAERLAGFDPALSDVAGTLDALYHQVAELARRIGDYASDTEASPERLEAIRERQDTLFRIKRKYGPEISDVLENKQSIQAEVDELEAGAFGTQEVQDKLAEREGVLKEAASRLRSLRADASRRIAEDVIALFPDLGMPEARLEVRLGYLDDTGPSGSETVEFRVSVNPGFDPLQLARIASGGELSRVMLALKSVLADVDEIPTLVFDEIDAGIGGVVAGAVGDQLRSVAGRHQVFVITHLPQIAARAHAHLLVEKGVDEEEGLASTSVNTLEGEGRVTEIARMLGGDPESETSQEHARELLAGA